MVHEVEAGVAQVRNSATEALLWLRRGLKFLKEFLSQVNAGEQDIHGALSEWWRVKCPVYSFPLILPLTQTFFPLDKAYGKTLRQYHGWVVRGVFAVGGLFFTDAVLSS